MYRKGSWLQENLGKVALMVLMLALILGFWAGSSPKLVSLFKLLPDSYRQGTESGGEITKIRYNLAEDRIEYYTGINWKQIVDEQEIMGKKYSYLGLYRDFVGHWYERDKENIIVQDSNTKAIVIDFNQYPIKIQNELMRGILSANHAPDFYLLTLSNQLYKKTKNIDIQFSEKIVFSENIGKFTIPFTFNNEKRQNYILKLNKHGLKGIDFSGKGDIVLDEHMTLKIIDFYEPGPYRGQRGEKLYELLFNGEETRIKIKLNLYREKPEISITSGEVSYPVEYDISEYALDSNENLRKALISWRDSKLKEPINIQGTYFCIESYKNDLVVDLRKIVNPEKACTLAEALS